MLSEFTSPANNKLCMYVSQTPDPTAGTWFAYDIDAPNFPDYPKYGLWEDAYFIGTNEGDNPVYAVPRQRLVQGPSGNISPIRFSTADRPGWLRNHIMPADLDGPAGPDGVPRLLRAAGRR